MSIRKITFKEIEDSGCKSVTDYSRKLLKEGSKIHKLLVYRNEMLCLTVSVKKASKLRQVEDRFVVYRG